MSTPILPSPLDVELFVLDVAIKATVVLAGAWIASLVLSPSRVSAATRHLVWTLALLAVVALPILSLTLPAWNIASTWLDLRPLVASSNDDLPQTPAWTNVPLAWVPTNIPTPDVDSNSPDVLSATFSSDVAMTSEPANSGLVLDTASSVSWLFIVWLAGCTMALVPLCAGLWRLRVIAKRSRPVTSGPLARAFRETASQLGLTKTVRLVQDDERPMPMTWGVWQATVLLPAEATTWSQEKLRAVLLHELSHVHRRDCLTQILAQLARAVYWFNPLAWLAERQLRLEQEKACDDMVLRLGLKPSDYAQHLLEILTGFRLPMCISALAMAMARKSKVEKRVRAILSSTQNRVPPSARRLGVASTVVMALTVAMAAIHFESDAAGTEAQNATAAAKANTATQDQKAGNQSSDKNTADKNAADQAQPLTDLRAKIVSQYFTPVNESEMVQGAIRGMIGALRDPYSDYLTPDKVAELEKQIGGTLVGIGVQLELHEKMVRVVTALPGSPALQAGIQPGDSIVQIDDHPTAGLGLPEIVKRVTGKEGSVVRLKIRRGGEPVIDLNVTRRPITLQTVKAFRAGSDDGSQFLLDARRKIGYVQITQFGPPTPKELRGAIESLKKQELKGLILDLRFCPGGMLDSAVESSKLFLSGGTIVSLHSRQGEPITIKADAASFAGDFPMIVLVNGQTASAAEVVAGALQDNRRAVVLGTRTVGKASVQSLIKLGDGGGAIKLTTSHYRLPSGRDIDKVAGGTSWGVDPDEGFFVPADRAQVKALLQRKQQRDVLGGKPGEKAGGEEVISAKSLEEQHADPQLSAAYKVMVARIETGTFAKVATLSTAQVSQFLKREEVELRRESLLQNLEQLDRELADLKNETSK